jgi:hypothetical protein
VFDDLGQVGDSGRFDSTFAVEELARAAGCVGGGAGGGDVDDEFRGLCDIRSPRAANDQDMGARICGGDGGEDLA